MYTDTRTCTQTNIVSRSLCAQNSLSLSLSVCVLLPRSLTRSRTRTGLDNLCLAEREGVVAEGHFLDGRAIQYLGLEKDDRVAIAHRCQQQALSLCRSARHHHLPCTHVSVPMCVRACMRPCACACLVRLSVCLSVSVCARGLGQMGNAHLEPGSMGKVGFRRLAMVQPPVADRAARRAHSQPAHIKHAAGPITILGRLIHQLSTHAHAHAPTHAHAHAHPPTHAHTNV
jgi:hypothetical protein